MLSIPTSLRESVDKSGKKGKKDPMYTQDSVQRRLGEIVFNQGNPEHMVSRQGKHLEHFRDKVQLFGIGDGEVTETERGSKKRELVVKLFTGMAAAKHKRAESLDLN